MQNLTGKTILDTRISETKAEEFGRIVVRENEKSVWFQNKKHDAVRVYRMNRSLAERQYRVVV